MTEVGDPGVTGALIDEISRPIGMVIIGFTLIEGALSALFEITADEVHAAGRKVKRPFALDDKIKICGKIFRNVDTLAPWRNSVESNIKLLKKAKVVRDTFAHGVISTYDQNTDVFTFNLVRPGDDHHSVEEVRVSKENVFRAADTSIGLSTFFQKLAHDLMQRE